MASDFAQFIFFDDGENEVFLCLPDLTDVGTSYLERKIVDWMDSCAALGNVSFSQSCALPSGKQGIFLRSPIDEGCHSNIGNRTMCARQQLKQIKSCNVGSQRVIITAWTVSSTCIGLTWEEIVAPLLVNQNRRHGVDEEMLLGNDFGCCKEIHVRLETFGGRMEGVPQNTRLRSYIHKENFILWFKHMEALDSGDMLHRRTGHPQCIRKHFLFWAFASIYEFLLAFYAGKTRKNNTQMIFVRFSSKKGVPPSSIGADAWNTHNIIVGYDWILKCFPTAVNRVQSILPTRTFVWTSDWATCAQIGSVRLQWLHHGA